MAFFSRHLSATIFCLASASLAVSGQVRVGTPAPAFTATDSNGQSHSLSQYHGKYVVLEWHNQGCPYTRKHYVSGNMQNLQKEWTARGVVWFTVISSPPGQQGFVTPSQENAYLEKMHAAPSAVLMDSDGKVGRLYNARTTPQMIVINPDGNVMYDGAIDNKPTPDVDDIPGADNYVNDALTAAMAGKPIVTPFTRPYGCSVKYRD